MIRSITEIGNLWPTCGNCMHIAQSHPNCNEIVIGQCPCCGTQGIKKVCGCKEYIGPTLEQFKSDYLTQEEITHYRF
jgi:hypothetical protein